MTTLRAWLADPNPASRRQARLGQAWLAWLRIRRNNLAMALLQAGCADEARRELDRLGDAPLAGALQEAVADTRRQLQGRTDTPACRVAMP